MILHPPDSVLFENIIASVRSNYRRNCFHERTMSYDCSELERIKLSYVFAVWSLIKVISHEFFIRLHVRAKNTLEIVLYIWALQEYTLFLRTAIDGHVLETASTIYSPDHVMFTCFQSVFQSTQRSHYVI